MHLKPFFPHAIFLFLDSVGSLTTSGVTATILIFIFLGMEFPLFVKLIPSKSILPFCALYLLQACHKQGVMLHDLKPENFLFANKKETAALKTIDFRLSIFFKPGIAFY